MVVYNIIVFGETGSGKSSLINMVAGAHVAEVSSTATGCTFQSKKHVVTINDKTFNFFDTAGLDEGEAGMVPKVDAVVQLFRLMKSLEEGVSLLLFVMRGPRIRENTPKNWRLFYEVFCQKKVPISLAITGLENELDMDAWWPRNKATFQAYDLNPSGFACITATLGRPLRSGGFSLEYEYEESKQKVIAMIQNHFLDKPWKVETIEWFTTVVTTIVEYRSCRKIKERQEVKTVVGPGIRALVDRCEMTEEAAKYLVSKLVE